VPTPRQWTHATLPCRLTAEEMERVLATWTGGSPTAWRHHALLLLLARLGVRAHEVADLCCEEIHWDEGWVRIRPGQTPRERVLPLVQEVGDAVTSSLQPGRPPSTSRHLFLDCRAPLRPLAAATASSRIATRALMRAGITSSARLGAHPFRHTAASQMGNRGARFKDVADVLGHRSLQTTGIEAKLTLDALVAVALPWMGAAVGATAAYLSTWAPTSVCGSPSGFRCGLSAPACGTLWAVSRRTGTVALSGRSWRWTGPGRRQAHGAAGALPSVYAWRAAFSLIGGPRSQSRKCHTVGSWPPSVDPSPLCLPRRRSPR
jgi:hypothetical protein